jgi:hypothetical protein
LRGLYGGETRLGKIFKACRTKVNGHPNPQSALKTFYAQNLKIKNCPKSKTKTGIENFNPRGGFAPLFSVEFSEFEGY